jgi:hypothetical protein
MLWGEKFYLHSSTKNVENCGRKYILMFVTSVQYILGLSGCEKMRIFFCVEISECIIIRMPDFGSKDKWMKCYATKCEMVENWNKLIFFCWIGTRTREGNKKTLQTTRQSHVLCIYIQSIFISVDAIQHAGIYIRKATILLANVAIYLSTQGFV